MKTFEQKNAYASPWSVKTRVGVLLWLFVYSLLFRPSPKHLKRWRLFLLKCFGAKISGHPFVSPTCKIKMPWHLEMEDHACLAPESEVYNLGRVILKARCTISQQAYLCAGTHDVSTSRLPLVTAPITIGEDVFIGARAFVLPGVTIGNGAVIGACSVVSKDMPEWMICLGNPCKPIKAREFKRE